MRWILVTGRPFYVAVNDVFCRFSLLYYEPNLRDASSLVSEIVVDIYHMGASL